jgi:hypothetical protein
VVRSLQAKTALTGDVIGLMDALPPLARTLRYGDVRRDAGTASLDVSAIERVVEELTARILIGLPLVCVSLDDDAAQRVREQIERVHAALALIQNQDLIDAWLHTLAQLVEQEGLHGVLGGRCCRLLYDQGAFDREEIARRLRLALSPAVKAAWSAAWLEGLLRSSGLLLLQDDNLWGILDKWVTALSRETFDVVFPLLRRTFSAFSAPERRQMGARVRRGPGERGVRTLHSNIDRGRADATLPLLATLLGLENGETER